MPGERFPTEIKLHQESRVMEIAFCDGRGFRLPYLGKLEAAGGKRE
jgi:DUF971 family protein